MSRLRFDTIDLTSVASPASGSYLVAYDLDGKLKQKDSAGVITEIGSGGTSGPVPVETNYPTTDALKAGQRFIYKGNEWHYMTQEEIDSTGWTGLVDVGFPAPVRKVFDLTLFATGTKIEFSSSTPRVMVTSGGLDNPIIDFIGLGNPNLYAVCVMNIPDKITEFKNARLLGNIEDIGTSHSLYLRYRQMTDSVINSLFSQLPATIKTCTIDVSENLGSATCDPSIATNKGYTVIT